MAAVKITTAITRMSLGNFSNAKGVGEGVLEYRIDYGPGYRIYFGKDGDRLVMLVAGGTKKRQQADIKTAQARWAEYKSGRQAEMALTRDFKETVRDRAQSDPAFRAALMSEAIELLLSGDVETGRALLRDYINATIGFVELSKKSGLPPKSLMRMFGPSGNPRADNLFAVIRLLQDETGVQIAVKAA